MKGSQKKYNFKLAQYISNKYEPNQINFDERKSGFYTSRKMRESMTNPKDIQLMFSRKYMKNINHSIKKYRINKKMKILKFEMIESYVKEKRWHLGTCPLALTDDDEDNKKRD